MLDPVTLGFIYLLSTFLDEPEPVSFAEAPTAELTIEEAPAAVDDAAPVDVPAPATKPAPPVSVVATETTRNPEPQDPTGQFLNATEVRPILGATKANWVGVRLYEGQDLLYFTSILPWRCGLWEIRYGVNGAAADQVLAMEPCYVDTARPGALTDPIGFPVWITFAPETVESVAVEIFYDDGTTDTATYVRNQILLP